MSTKALSGFRYFSGPVADVRLLEEGCSFCGENGPAMSAGGGQNGCLECLRKGKFTLVHDTDLGTLEDGKFFVFDHSVERMVANPAPDELRPEALEELPRTPRYMSHQGCHFPLHCMDVMTYIGRWSPADFLRHQPEDPKALYLATSEGDPQLWENAANELAGEAGDWPTEASHEWAWGSWCYMFRCLHCGALSSHWDCG